MYWNNLYKLYKQKSRATGWRERLRATSVVELGRIYPGNEDTAEGAANLSNPRLTPTRTHSGGDSKDSNSWKSDKS